MEKALTFLPDWLAVGLAAMAFFGVGLFLAKMVWGRYARRLATAVDENMNLIGQWSSLGSAQHELFKKLRNRWQEDRDSWETSADAWKEQLGQKDESIKKLLAEVKRLRSDKTPEVIVNDNSDELNELRTALASAKADLIDALDELSDVRDGYNEKTSLVAELENRPVETVVQTDSEEVDRLSVKLASVEADLVDALDELTDVRVGYNAKADRVVELESADVDVEPEVIVDEERINELSAENKQLSALLSERSREMVGLRDTNSRLEDEIEALKNVEAPEPEVIVDETLVLGLQGDLKDALDEMDDVRVGYNEKADEISLLEAYVDELVNELDAAPNPGDLEEASDLRAELADVRFGYNTKAGEVNALTSQLAELEAIIEDRNNEVEDASNELVEHLGKINEYKARISELESELSENEGVDMDGIQQELLEKSELADYLSSRIEEVEAALADRYAEVNKVRAQWSRADGRAKVYEERTEELLRTMAEYDAETKRLREILDDKETTLEPLTSRVEELETTLAETESARSELATALEAHEKALAAAEVETSELRQALTDRADALEFANSELTGVKKELDARFREDEDRVAEMKDLLRQVDEYDQNLTARDQKILQLEEAVNRIESEADSLNVMVDEGKRNANDLEEKLADLQEQVVLRDGEIGVFTREINSLVSDIEKNDSDGGVSRLAKLSGEDAVVLSPGDGIGKAHTDVLNDTISDLQNRLQAAESNHGSCEREKGIMREQNESIREKYEMELRSRDKQISILTEEVSSHQDKLRELRSEMERADERPHHVFTDYEVPAVQEYSRISIPEPEKEIEPVDRVSQPVETSLNVFFDEGTDYIKATERAKIDDALRSMREKGSDYQVVVDGFADHEGSDDFNESISARRADAVRHRLIESGLPQDMIAVRGRGEDHQFSGDEANAWKARRVEVMFVPQAVAETVN